MRLVTIVDIDEKSLADPRLGQWPWPRTRLADIITNLTRLGAVVIAFDAVFSEPDRLNPDIAADTFRNLDEATRERLRALPSNDQIFADAIKQSRVVLGEPGGPEVHTLDTALHSRSRQVRVLAKAIPRYRPTLHAAQAASNVQGTQVAFTRRPPGSAVGSHWFRELSDWRVMNWSPKALSPPAAVRSAGWPTRPFHCPSDANPGDGCGRAGR